MRAPPRQSSRLYAPLWALLALTALGHLPLMVVPPLSSDEALYWEWARHLALGYYTHPPMVGWTNALLTGLMGTSAFTVRLTALGYHLGTVALLYQMALEVTGERRVPLLAGLLYVLLPVSIILGTASVTDCPLVFFWAATAWLTKRAVIDGRHGCWYLAGVAAGGMMLSKFFAVLFFPAQLLFLLLHPRYRGELARKEPWLAALIALLVLSPFVYWNATHAWLTFQFNAVSRQAGDRFSLLKPLLYLVGQFIAASPVVFVVLLVALAAVLVAGWRGVRRPRASWHSPEQGPAARAENALLYYAVLTAVPLLIFLPVSFEAVIGSHWTAVVYPTGAVVLMAWLYGLPAAWQRGGTGAGWGAPLRLRHPRTAWASWVLLLACAMPLALILLAPGVLPRRFIAYDEARQHSSVVAKYWGWHQVGAEIARLRKQYGDLPGGLWFSTRDYSQAAMLGFYTPNHEQLVLMGYERQEIHGKEFLYWGKPIKRLGSNSIFVMDEPIFPNNEQRIRPYFREVRPLETLVIRDAQGRVLRKFFFALCLDYQDHEPDVLSRW